MNRTILQVPINVQLRQEAEREAIAQGFSSLQEAVRVFLRKLSEKTIMVTFQEKTIQLSSAAIKKYNKMIDEIESGKIKTKTFPNRPHQPGSEETQTDRRQKRTLRLFCCRRYSRSLFTNFWGRSDFIGYRNPQSGLLKASRKPSLARIN